jgi:hypothetical protein
MFPVGPQHLDIVDPYGRRQLTVMIVYIGQDMAAIVDDLRTRGILCGKPTPTGDKHER